MRHFANRTFWQGYDRLPQNVRLLADKNFTLLKGNPRHPSLHFKKIGRFWSARVGIGHRALAVELADGMLWFWIGSHADYNAQIKSERP
jgi:hypothetical protein